MDTTSYVAMTSFIRLFKGTDLQCILVHTELFLKRPCILAHTKFGDHQPPTNLSYSDVFYVTTIHHLCTSVMHVLLTSFCSRLLRHHQGAVTTCLCHMPSVFIELSPGITIVRSNGCFIKLLKGQVPFCWKLNTIACKPTRLREYHCSELELTMKEPVNWNLCNL